LEYLMTYGWALILIATVVGVLVFVVSSPAENVVFTVSEPTKFTLKGQALSGSNLEVKLQNITGGPITLNEITIPAEYGNCEVNENPFAPGTTSTSINIGAGGEIFIDCPNVANATGQVEFEYQDAAGLQRQVSMKASSSGTTGSGGCIDGATQNCPLQQGECSGAKQTCTSGSWPGCTTTTYQANDPDYEATETSCSDGKDNDCDGATDCDDLDCLGLPPSMNCAPFYLSATEGWDNGTWDYINSAEGFPFESGCPESDYPNECVNYRILFETGPYAGQLVDISSDPDYLYDQCWPGGESCALIDLEFVPDGYPYGMYGESELTDGPWNYYLIVPHS
jgi:hypothetical protein